jgi:hypothetical protein
MAKKTRKGRSSGEGRFTQLHEYMQNTAAWSTLKPQDRAVYIEVARVYNGLNNGSLARSVRQLADGANINKDTAGRCLKTLVERGFLECATPGGFNRKVPHAAEWRLTVYRCDRTGALPTKAFMKWQPQSQTRSPETGRPVRKQGTVVVSLALNGPKLGDDKGVLDR